MTTKLPPEMEATINGARIRPSDVPGYAVRIDKDTGEQVTRIDYCQGAEDMRNAIKRDPAEAGPWVRWNETGREAVDEALVAWAKRWGLLVFPLGDLEQDIHRALGVEEEK